VPKLKDISAGQQLVSIQDRYLLPLPAPYDQHVARRGLRAGVDGCLDGFSALGMRRPSTPEEARNLVDAFLSGMRKLLTKENNWAFLEQLTLTLDNCTACQTCADACPIYVSSGRNEVYSPTYRGEVFRRIVKQYVRRGGGWISSLKGESIELTATTICRLVELAYRCTLCRRCAQACPIGVDNALITRELRKVFSMEMGIAPREIHDKGSMVQLRVGSSTGMNGRAVKDNIEFLDDELFEQTGIQVHTPWDKEGADVLLVHNAGEILSWPENPMAFALILDAAGISWTMSSDLAGYDNVNYGLWYDDVQFARIAIRQAEAARKLRVKKVVVGECGHGHKAAMVIADRLRVGMNIPHESSLVLLRDIVRSGRLKLDPSRNDFPVTLHDPCNMVRMMGIVEPQREILRSICPQFREMTPHGVENYCCGGGSGFALMSGNNFEDWRLSISGRMKLKQVLDAFSDCAVDTPKYVCAPCSNCKGQFRDLFRYHGVWEKSRIAYGGLAELIVNAMTDVKEPFIKWESQ
jgi:Fe-S oxidoreductase